MQPWDNKNVTFKVRAGKSKLQRHIGINSISTLQIMVLRLNAVQMRSSVKPVNILYINICTDVESALTFLTLKWNFFSALVDLHTGFIN